MARSVAAWWNDRSLRGKGFVVVAVPVAALVAITALFLSASVAADREARAFEQASSVRTATDKVLHDILKGEAAVYAYLLAQDEVALGPYAAAVTHLPYHRSRMRAALAVDQELRTEGAQLESLIDMRMYELDLLLARGSLSGSHFQVMAGVATMEEIQSLVDSIEQKQERAVRVFEADRRNASARARRAAVLGIALGILGGLLGSVVFARSIAGRVRRNRENAELLVRGLPLRPAPQGADEVGRSGAALVEAATRIRDAERKIRQDKELLQAILDQMGEGVVVVDGQGWNVLFNPAAGSILGLGASATPPERWVEHFGLFMADGETPFPTAELPLLLATRGVSTDDITLLVRNTARADGAFVSMSGRPLLRADGTADGGLVVFRDITQAREADRRLEDYRQDLERSNQELERFAYIASHDLQEPLRMVASHVQLLAGDLQGTLGPDQEESIGFAVDGAKRMQRLINDLLTYSRVGRRGKPFTPTPLQDVLQTALLNLDVAVREQHASVTSDELPVVDVDPGQLTQLLQNLIGNAIKFHGAEPPGVHVGAEVHGDEWIFTVEDNGIGVPEDQAERVFQIFQRLHSRSEYEGTGIGLAVCRRIVERHGGRIWVEPRSPHGSRFRFTIPVTTKELAA
jgi:signal transduction histidine kinase/CHASE3 domain sensor protein